MKYTSHPLYSTYCGMKQRCNDNPNYLNRGITVCDRWLGRQGFANFLYDMGAKPSPEHTLERIDNKRGYEVSNCKWATRLEQAFNRRVFKNNKAGLTGVSWHKGVRKWVAQARINGYKKHLGYFPTKEEAHTAYLVATEGRVYSVV